MMEHPEASKVRKVIPNVPELHCTKHIGEISSAEMQCSVKKVTSGIIANGRTKRIERTLWHKQKDRIHFTQYRKHSSKDQIIVSLKSRNNRSKKNKGCVLCGNEKHQLERWQVQCLLPFDCGTLLRKCQLAYWIFNIVLYAFFSIVFEPAALILSCLLVCVAFAARFIY